MVSKTNQSSSSALITIPPSWHLLAMNPLSDLINKIQSYLDGKESLSFFRSCRTLCDLAKKNSQLFLTVRCNSQPATPLTSRELRKCPSLLKFKKGKEFHLSNSKITLAEFRDLVNHYPKIESIDLSFCDQVTDEWLVIIGEKYKGLKKLNLSFVPEITGDGIEALARNCAHLQEVAFAGNPKLWRNAVELLIRNNKLLESLTVRASYYFTDDVLKLLGEKCPKLRKVFFQDCDISNTGIAFLKGLEKVTLKFCNRITDTGIQALAKKCPGLLELTLFRIKVATHGLIRLGLCCPGLQKLELILCKSVSLVGLIVVACSCKELQRLQLLSCPQVTDEWLDKLAFPSLQNLILSNQKKVTDAGIERFLAKNPETEIYIHPNRTLLSPLKKERIKQEQDKKNLEYREMIRLRPFDLAQKLNQIDQVHKWQLRLIEARLKGVIDAPIPSPEPEPVTSTPSFRAVASYFLRQPEIKPLAIALLAASGGVWAGVAGLAVWGGSSLAGRCRQMR